jgi:hypothetical protein
MSETSAPNEQSLPVCLLPSELKPLIAAVNSEHKETINETN